MEAGNTSIQPQELWEAAERAIQEIEALEAIYGHSSFDDHEKDADAAELDSSSLVVPSSREDLKKVQTILESIHSGESLDSGSLPLALVLEIQTPVELHLDDDDDDDNSTPSMKARIRIRLPVGYPEYQAACVTSLTVTDANSKSTILKRAAVEEIVSTLNDKAASLLGVEAVMDVMETAKEMVADTIKLQTKEKTSQEQEQQPSSSSGYGRRWIWVHHITNTERRKSILKEAKAMGLGGYLKYGYPGIIVVEGTSSNCDEFVGWVKGNKSRPGGFGRNWGHHVRGEIDVAEASELRLPKQFEETEELAVLSAACKEAGLQDEFLEFAMQHKGTNG